MTHTYKKAGAVAGLFAVIALLCAPFTAPRAEAAAADWHRSVSVTSRYAEDWTSDGFKQSVRNAKAMGANYITLIIPYIQSDYGSHDIRNNWNTPSDATLGAAIDFIHSEGLKVSLKPHLEVGNAGWRALIEARDRNAWYAAYGSLLNRLGDIGKTKGAEMIVAGTELIGMASPYVNPDNTQRWQNLIAGLRSRYSGKITYSANWGRGITHTNEFEQIGFWNSLDYIGISAYFELGHDWNRNSVSDFKGEWQTIDQNQVGPLQARIGKPVIFTEVGYKPVDGAHTRPWDYNHNPGYNPTEQSNLFQALIEYWNGRSYFHGLSIWEWSSDPNYGGPGNLDYTPHNKPAENIIKTGWSGGSTPTNPTTPTTTPTNPTNPQPAPTGEWSASTGSFTNPTTGQSSTIPVTLSITGSAQNVIADIEIYNEQQSRVAQAFFEGQNISASSPGQYSITWTPASAGRYTLKAAAFKSGWSQTYYWNDNLKTIDVVNPGQTPPPQEPPQNPGQPTQPTPVPTTYTTDVWWPADGTAISGSQPFKAMVQNRDVSQYTMYWQVDGRQLNLMSNNYTDYPHKEVQVNVSEFNWNGAGPYAIKFVSKDNTGATISEKTVNIEVR